MPKMVWTPEAKRSVAPRTAKEAAERTATRSMEWTALRESLKRLVSATNNDPTLTEPLRGVQGWVERTSPPSEATPDQIGIVVALLGFTMNAWLADRFGAQLAVRGMATPIDTQWLSSESRFAVVRGTRTHWGLAVREIVLQQGEKEREEIRAAMQDVWDAGDGAARVSLAFGFPFHEPWRAQALKELLAGGTPFDNVQITLASSAEEMRAVLERAPNVNVLHHLEITATLGQDALPILLEMAPKIRNNGPHLSHARALGVFVCEEVARHFAARLTHPTTREMLERWFETHKDLAAVVLPAASEGSSRNAALAKALALKVVGPAESTEETASLDDPAVPEVLREAPWRGSPPPWPNLGLSMEAYPEKITVPEDVRKADLDWVAAQRTAPEMTAEETKAYLAVLGDQMQRAWIHGTPMTNPEQPHRSLPLPTLLELYNKGRFWVYGRFPQVMFSLFGEAALPGLMFHFRQITHAARPWFDTPRFAEPIAENVFDRTRPNAVEWSWFEQQPRAGAFGLLCMMHDTQKQRLAEHALRALARTHREVVLEVAAQTKHEDRVRELLDRDARRVVFAPLSAVTVPPGITRLRLRDGRPVADEVTLRVLEMVASVPPGDPYPGFDDVKAAFDPETLAEMSWDLAALADAKPRRRQTAPPPWMRWALVPFANERVIRRLTPALKHDGVYRALELLAMRGSNAAVLELATAHEREDSHGRYSMTLVAKALGVSVHELGERTLPTTPLDELGGTTLKYGSRTLRVGFDTTLAPYLFEGDKRLGALPRAKKSDDPVEVRLAKETWDELKEDVRTIAELRYKVLDDSMHGRSPIPAPRFLAHWAHHPMGKHLARGMIWGTERDGRLVTFRVAEDSTLADLDDSALELREDEIVIVPHPLDLSREELDRWSEIFHDYNLIQPVAQLGRTGIALTPEEELATEIVRVPTPPLPWLAFHRVLQSRAMWTQYGMKRVVGETHINFDRTWGKPATVTKVRLQFKVGGELLPAARVHPLERAEALYVMRLLLEVS